MEQCDIFLSSVQLCEIWSCENVRQNPLKGMRCVISNELYIRCVSEEHHIRWDSRWTLHRPSIVCMYIYFVCTYTWACMSHLVAYMCVFVCSESYLWWWQTAKLKMKRSETKHCCSNLRVKASFALLYRIVVYRVYSIVRSNSSYYETIKFTYGWILFLICPPHTHTSR